MKKQFTFSAMLLLTVTVLNGQCFPDRHNSTWFDGWISCQTKISPNPDRPSGHWILYDFNQPYDLFEMDIWNTNAPELIDYGMQDVVIDISMDSSSWTEFGQFTFSQGAGFNSYEGGEEVDFDSTTARYVLISGLSNYGGPCYGMSEIRIRAKDLCPINAISWIGGDAGMWDNPFNWCTHKVPNKNTRVILPSAVHVTVPLDYTAHVWTLSMEATAQLIVLGTLHAHRKVTVVNEVDPEIFEDP